MELGIEALPGAGGTGTRVQETEDRSWKGRLLSPALSSIRNGGEGVYCVDVNPGWLLRRDPGLRDASPLGSGGGKRDKDGAGGIGNLRFQDLKGGAEGEIMKDEL
jgi:hypothetical protein